MRVALAVVLVPGVGVRVEHDHGHRPVAAHRPQVRQRDRVVAAEQERDHAGLGERPDVVLDRLVAALGEARDDRDVAAVDAGQMLERLDVERRVVGAQEQRGRADGVRPEPPADPEGDAGVERDPDDRDVHVLERVHQRQPRERGDAHEAGRQAGIGGLVARHHTLPRDASPVTGKARSVPRQPIG